MSNRDSIRESVQRYRDRMRRSGFRLVQMWVPDTRADGFAKECRRQSLQASRHTDLENDVMDWVDLTRDTDGWTS